MNDVNTVILVYSPNQKQPDFIKVNKENFNVVVSTICNGFEIVYARKLHEIYESAVFICCDDYKRLASPLTNKLGTYLYNGDNSSVYGNWPILGSICIAKMIRNHCGEEDVSGFTRPEAQCLCKLLKRWVNKVNP